MFNNVPRSELDNRMQRLRRRLDRDDPDWRLLIVVSKINQFYLTGTMQDGLVIVPRDREATYWVRRSLQRAQDESEFGDIRPMGSFRDAAAALSRSPETVHLESERVPLATWQRINKHFQFKQFASADLSLSAIRAVKSLYELGKIAEAGRIHQRVLEERVPKLFQEGISEAEFGARLYPVLVEEGHHGIARFAMFETEILLGHICFGESSIYPTSFDGPGGNYGMSPAVPLLGSRQRVLKPGDLVFVDIGCGVDGYHTDKTMTYVYKGELPPQAVAAHQRCVAIQNATAALLKPGAVPEEIYDTITRDLEAGFLDNFMGFGDRQARFLGHGIGLHIDEWPVIAKGFDEPLQENMVLAIEPKKGIAGIGMVGTENTFVVTPQGGRCLTGNHPGLLEIG
ncbi:MAG: Xaa-Pro peptidase family protein [Thermodesulfobacteriota bacterium]|jgi:Xaa-Pro aminopeptidase|nr:Xaa-Pro peptidase family protein [Thermodesulfobacteriota bacterium]